MVVGLLEGGDWVREEKISSLWLKIGTWGGDTWHTDNVSHQFVDPFVSLVAHLVY